MKKWIKSKVCFLGISLVFLCMTGGFSARAQVVDVISGLDFGSFDFAGSYNVRLQLGTDGNVQVVGTGVSMNGGEAAGHVRITLPDTGLVDIKCSTEAVLTDPTATSLTIENIEIAVTSGLSFGDATPCQGIGGGDAIAVTIDMDAILDPDVYIGGEIVISGAITLPSDHVYNTTGTGTPITLSIVTQ